ncbi:MAG: GNAT family N-acetyltransferase [Alphaproteobacteria bacterium]
MEHATTHRTDNSLKGIKVRLVQDDSELQAAQNLRYKVFYEEYGAIPSEEMIKLERDFDEFDKIADHLIVTDTDGGDEKIVGTYRLMTQKSLKKGDRFYSSGEYDLSKLLDTGLNLMELGRSCVLPPYRAGSVLQLLWQGIADYISDHDIDIMFGCASLHNTDIEALAQPLSYMYHYHLIDESLRPKAIDDRYINMNILPKDDINIKAAFSDLPPLIKGYLRVGAMIGDGAVIDPQFKTTDVCIVAQCHLVTDRYRKHYERKIEKVIPSQPKQTQKPSSNNKTD